MTLHNKVHTFFNSTSNYLHQSFGIRIRAEIIKELVGAPVSKRILDVGCGNGSVSNQFIQDNHITFLDLSENMIDLVKRGIDPTFTGNANFLVGSFADISIMDEYDFIFAIGLLAHVPSVPECLKRINSLLTQKGYAVIQFSDYDRWLTKYNIRKATRYGYPINQLSLQSMKGIITATGFEIVREIRFSFLLPGMGKLPESFLYHYTKLSWRNKTLSGLGTDVIWLLKRQEG
jgi:ubiquinone/menaquinone biosynthesis C-methylase UbiE